MSHEQFRHRCIRIAASATTAALALAGPTIATPAHAAAPISIQLVGINDFHGRIWSSPNNQLAGTMIGKVNQLRGQNPNTIFVSSGDNIGASTFESFIGLDNPTIDVLNAGGLEVSAVGNHEFDQGLDALLDRIPSSFGGVEDPATDLHKTDFPYLGANVYRKGTQTPALPEYAIQERDGIKLGFVGLVTAETASLVSPGGIKTVDFGDPLVALNRVAGQLTDGNTANGEADVIVALVHDGSNSTDCPTIAAEPTNFGKLVREASSKVDVIYSAHTHMAYNCTIGGRPVIQSGSYATNLAQVVVDVDPGTRKVTSATSALIPLTAGSVTPDPTIVSIVNAAVTAAGETGSKPVGKITADIPRAKLSSGADDRGSESSLGSLVADMQLWATSENPNYGGAEPAVMAFMNPGGLRADLVYAPDGVVTYKEAALVQPFANTLVTSTLTGAQIRSVLEEQWQPAGAARPVLRLGISAGLSYTYDPSAPAGKHVLSVRFNGRPLKSSAEYRVVMNSFLSTGGDNFFTLAKGKSTTDSGQVDLQAAVEYFEAHPSVSPPALGRAKAVLVPPSNPGKLTKANVGPVKVASQARQGEQVVVTVGKDLATRPVEVWLYSPATQLYAGPVAADGTVTVTIPEGAWPATYALAVTTDTDALVGWGAVRVTWATPPGVNLSLPQIAGRPVVGQLLVASPGQWTQPVLAYLFQWKRDGVPIAWAWSPVYRPTSADVGRKLTVTVTALAPGVSAGVATSTPVTTTVR